MSKKKGRFEMQYYHASGRAHYFSHDTEGPVRSFTELMVKFAYFLIVVGLIVHAAMQPSARKTEAMRPNEVAALREARFVVENFRLKGGDWTDEEVLAARDRVHILRNSVCVTNVCDQMLTGELRRVYDMAFAMHDERIRMAQGDAATQWAASAKLELDRKFTQTFPSVQRPPEMRRRNRSMMLSMARFAGKCYLLFIPFAFLVYLVRAREMGSSLVEEVAIRWKELAAASLFFPAGLGSYPESSAAVMRRRFFEAEYRARRGLDSYAKLSRADEIAIEELVHAPVRELKTRLDALTEVPSEMVWRARLALYAAAFVAMLASPFRSARADSGSTSDGGATKRPPAVEVHGFVQAAGGVPAGEVPFGLQHLRFMVAMRPVDGVELNVIHETSAGRLLDASITVHPAGSDFDLRMGQITPRLGYLSPPPHKEPLIGGPGAAANLAFLDVGVELHGSHGVLEESLAVVSGSGGNQSDQNGGKDVIATVSVRPFGGLLFELAFWTGVQPEDGRVTRGAAHASYRRGGFAVDGLATVLTVGDEESSAASGSVAYRSGAVRGSAGFDGMWLAGIPPDYVGRAQVSVYPLNGDDHLQVSAMGRMSREHGTSGTVQVQAGF